MPELVHLPTTGDGDGDGDGDGTESPMHMLSAAVALVNATEDPGMRRHVLTAALNLIDPDGVESRARAQTTAIREIITHVLSDARLRGQEQVLRAWLRTHHPDAMLPGETPIAAAMRLLERRPLLDDDWIPPAVRSARIPVPVYRAAVHGAARLDVGARTGNGRNLIAHALAELVARGMLPPADTDTDADTDADGGTDV